MENLNPIMSARPKASPANIIGLFGFAMLAISEIVLFVAFKFVLFPIAYIAIGCFFVMDMRKRDGGGKIIDIIGLVGVLALLISSLRDFLIYLGSNSVFEINDIILISNCLLYSGIFLLTLFFAGFLGNAKLYIPSICVITFELIYLALPIFSIMNMDMDDYITYLKIVGIVEIIASCSMVWFMYQYMCMGGVDKIKSGPQYSIRQIALGLCFCLGVAFLFLPIAKFWLMGLMSMYELLPHDFGPFMEGDGSASVVKAMLLTFIPAIILLAASVKDKDYIKPLIALCLTLIPFLILLCTGWIEYSSWMTAFVILYLVFIGLTTKIIIDSRKEETTQNN